MSELNKQIKQAIGAHGLWKARLKDAVESGTLPMPVEQAKGDNHCQFGQWLYQVKGTADAASPHFARVLGLHREFHEEVGSLLDLVLRGSTNQAKRLLQTGGRYDQLSFSLTSEMMNWLTEMQEAGTAAVTSSQRG